MASLVVYPDAGSGATTVDGNVQRAGVSEAFSTIRSGAGTGSNTTLASPMTKITSDTTVDKYLEFRRLIATWDTSPLTASANITGVVVSPWGIDGYTTFAESPDFDVVAATPASNNNLVNSDYGQTGNTPFGSVPLASWVTGAYNNITLDANGIANINKTGISRFGFKLSWDTDNVAPTWAANNKEAAFQIRGADTAGTDQGPKLTITYTLGSSTTASSNLLTLLGVG